MGASAGRVTPGIDVLLGREPERLAGKTVGVLAHPASCTSRLEHLVDRLLAMPETCVGAIFGPEHGYRGAAQDMEGVAGERIGDIPIHSLYGRDEASLRPPPGSLDGLDLFLIDLQDVGCRYYTFAHTMILCMAACRAAGVPVLVLDRPNPIGGSTLEGPLLRPGFESFVGRFPIPVRHGMTIGELARMANEAFGIGCALTVIPMAGWRREMLFADTGLPWVLPSPNMPTPATALVYPGMCLLEATNLSEGRGTTRPFELFGAPWIDPARLVRALAEYDLPGVRFRPCFFRPTFHKHAGKTCGGAQVHVTDPDAFRPFLTGLAVIHAVRTLYPDEFRWRAEPYEFVADRPAFDLLVGNKDIRAMIEAGRPLDEIADTWREDETAFREARQPFLLYDADPERERGAGR